MLSQSHIRGVLGSWETATQYTVPATLLDVSGNGNNGTNNGAVFTADHLGNKFEALSYSGTSISYSNYTGLDLTSDFSVTVCFKLSSTVLKHT